MVGRKEGGITPATIKATLKAKPAKATGGGTFNTARKPAKSAPPNPM
jgi:hypothetical protein